MKSENARITAINVDRDYSLSGKSRHSKTTVELMLPQELQAPSGMCGLSELRCTLIVHEPDSSPGEQLRAAHIERAKAVGAAVTHPSVAWRELSAAAQAVWEANAAFAPTPRKSLGQVAYESCGPCGLRWAEISQKDRGHWQQVADAVVAEFCR